MTIYINEFELINTYESKIGSYSYVLSIHKRRIIRGDMFWVTDYVISTNHGKKKTKDTITEL